MNASRIALFAAALLPLAVSAQEATAEPAAAVSQLSRADVRGALDHARASGGMEVFRSGYIGDVAEPRSRADVMAELRRARANGEWAALNAEAATFGAPRAGAAPSWMAMKRER